MVLSAACVAAGRAMSPTSLVHAVLRVEQLMTAGERVSYRLNLSKRFFAVDATTRSDAGVPWTLPGIEGVCVLRRMCLFFVSVYFVSICGGEAPGQDTAPPKGLRTVG